MKPAPQAAHVSYTRFLEHVRAGEVAQAMVTARSETAPLTAQLHNGRSVDTLLPGDYHQALTLMLERNVNVEIVAPAPSILNAAPFAILLAAWLIAMWFLRFRKIEVRHAE